MSSKNVWSISGLGQLYALITGRIRHSRGTEALFSL